MEIAMNTCDSKNNVMLEILTLLAQVSIPKENLEEI
jgi:hypothetical protein